MTQIVKEGGKTIIKTDKRIDTMNAAQFEQDIEPVFSEPDAERKVQDYQCQSRDLQGARHDRLHQVYDRRTKAGIVP